MQLFKSLLPYFPCNLPRRYSLKPQFKPRLINFEGCATTKPDLPCCQQPQHFLLLQYGKADDVSYLPRIVIQVLSLFLSD